MSGKPEAIIVISNDGTKKTNSVWYNSKYDRDFFYEEDKKYGWQFKFLNNKNKVKYDKFWLEFGDNT